MVIRIIDVKVRTPRIKRLEKMFGDATETNRLISERMMAGVREQFRTRGSRFGEKWREYSRLTLYSKRLRGPKGNMLAGLLAKIVPRYGKYFAAVATEDKLVALHHLGSQKKDYPIPKTPGKLAYPHPEGRISQLYEGRWVFGKRLQVIHPGVFARRMFPTLEQAKEMATEVVTREINKETR